DFSKPAVRLNQSNGMDAPTRNGIVVPEWKCHQTTRNGRGVQYEHYDNWHRLGEKRVSDPRRRPTRQERAEEATQTRSDGLVLCQPTRVSNRHGGMRQFTSLGPQAAGFGTHGTAHGPAVRQALR